MPEFFFVIGMVKSGTTWLQQLLNAHPELSCTNELGQTLLSDFLGKAIHDYNAMQSKRTHPKDLPGPITAPEALEMLRALVEIRMRHLASPGSRKIGDKHPLFARSTDLIFQTFPDAQFIHIVRDPRDVLVSLRQYAKNFYPDLTGTAAAEHARNWPSLLRQIRNKARASGVEYKELKYEEMLELPAAVLAGILDFLAADSDPDTVAQCIQHGSFEALSGGRRQGSEDESSFFRKGVAGDWRNHLTPQECALIRNASGGLMDELGYT